MLCHMECGEVGGEEWRQQEKPEQESPQCCNSSPKSLSNPKGSSAAHLVHRDRLGDSSVPAVLPGLSLLDPAWDRAGATARLPWEMAQWKMQIGGLSEFKSVLTLSWMGGKCLFSLIFV